MLIQAMKDLGNLYIDQLIVMIHLILTRIG